MREWQWRTENGMDGMRRTALVCVMVALVLSCKDSGSSDVEHGDGAAGSAPSKPSTGQCPPPNDILAINLGCHSGEKPLVKTTGPCTLTSSAFSGSVYLQTNDAGTCHVELTSGSDATSFVDVKIVSRWRAIGSDPHGCGQEFVGVTETGEPCLPSGCEFSVPERECDAAH
jgi:hypothetical protein